MGIVLCYVTWNLRWDFLWDCLDGWDSCLLLLTEQVKVVLVDAQGRMHGNYQIGLNTGSCEHNTQLQDSASLDTRTWSYICMKNKHKHTASCAHARTLVRTSLWAFRYQISRQPQICLQWRTHGSAFDLLVFGAFPYIQSNSAGWI